MSILDTIKGFFMTAKLDDAALAEIDAAGEQAGNAAAGAFLGGFERAIGQRLLGHRNAYDGQTIDVEPEDA